MKTTVLLNYNLIGQSDKSFSGTNIHQDAQGVTDLPDGLFGE